MVDLNQQIKKLEDEIAALKSENQEYQALNASIAAATQTLGSAKQSLDSAKGRFSSCYTGKEANKKITSIGADSARIGNIISKLNSSVLAESKRIITENTALIRTKEAEIQKLKEKLNAQ